MTEEINFRSSNPQISNHLRNYHTLLKGGSQVDIKELVDSYRQMQPLLHREINSDKIDIDALNYAATRLPSNIFQATGIFLICSFEDLGKLNFKPENLVLVEAVNRRRLVWHDPKDNNFIFLLNSDSDIDDLVNCLLAYQIEFEKIKHKYHSPFKLSDELCEHLKLIIGQHCDEFKKYLERDLNFKLSLISYDPSKYAQNCRQWWKENATHSMVFDFKNTPVYFVSSNSQSIIDVIGGYPNWRQSYIFDFASKNYPQIYNEWLKNKASKQIERTNDFIYYLSSKFLSRNPEFVADKEKYEKDIGIIKIKSQNRFPTDIQIIPVRTIAASRHLDDFLSVPNRLLLEQSPALIVNIQYPLGLAAGYLLDEIMNYFDQLKSVYIIGKAAIFSGNIGDIQIPKTVLDENTNNIYIFDNVFNNFFPPKANVNSIHTQQKAVCVSGTFLENESQMQNYIATGVNIVEMESGHFLGSIVRNCMLGGQPLSSANVYKINNCAFDLGIINYASDIPLVQNLTQESMALRSIESTYLSSVSVVQRIINLESGIK